MNSTLLELPPVQDLAEAKAEVKNLKAERFGKQSEKNSAVDRSNDLNDPQGRATAKKKRGQQPGSPAPKRRDYSHLPAREELADLPEEAKVCECCGKPLADLGQSDAVEQIEIETTVYRRVIRSQALSSNLRLLDETRWKVFVEKAGKTGHLWWLWLFAGEETVVYVLDPSRSHDVPQSHFGDSQGTLMVDRYIAYKIMRPC